MYHLGVFEMPDDELEASDAARLELKSSIWRSGVGGRVIFEAIDGGGETFADDEIIGVDEAGSTLLTTTASDAVEAFVNSWWCDI